jgi:hypothetical protein
MTKAGININLLHELDLDRIEEELDGYRLICCTCGGVVPYYPVESKFQHMLKHATGAERRDIEEVLRALADPEQRKAMSLYVLQQLGIDDLIEYAAKNGLFKRSSGRSS